MALKLFKAMWFMSVLATLASLLYVYASLPESVIIPAQDRLTVSREWLFYILLGAILLVNVLVYFVKMMAGEGESLRAWFHGLVITINIFMIISMQTLQVANSNEFSGHSLVQAYLTGSLVLILIWAASWPVYVVFNKFFIKQAL